MKNEKECLKRIFKLIKTFNFEIHFKTDLFVILVEDGRALVGTAGQDPARVVRVDVQRQNSGNAGGVKTCRMTKHNLLLSPY